MINIFDVYIHLNHNMFHWMTYAVGYHEDSWVTNASIERARVASKVEHLKGGVVYRFRAIRDSQNGLQNDTQMTPMTGGHWHH